MVPGVTVVSPPDKSLADKEQALLDRYAPVMRSFVQENLQLQLTAINSLQSYCYSLNFPKGYYHSTILVYFTIDKLKKKI